MNDLETIGYYKKIDPEKGQDISQTFKETSAPSVSIFKETLELIIRFFWLRDDKSGRDQGHADPLLGQALAKTMVIIRKPRITERAYDADLNFI